MEKFVMLVHGGAGPDSDLIRKNIEGYKKGLKEAVEAGYLVLSNGGTAIDAVEKSVNVLEDNLLFNAGRGSALNEKGEVQMDASIMDGKDLKAGATCLIKNVKNPVSLARLIMEKSKHIYIGGKDALEYAVNNGIKLMPDSYFISEHAYQQYEDARKEEGKSTALDHQTIKVKGHGTVGAVCLDKYGNIAAATSTGGIENKSAGRIGDSSLIGIGSYANNKTCAVSCTGDGEYIMQNVVAFHLPAIMKYKELKLKEAGKYLLQKELKHTAGDIGFIAVDDKGSFTMEFNSERMHRAWMSSDGEQGVKIYID